METPIINQTRELLSQGNTAKAFQILISALNSQSNHASLLQSLRVGEANYQNIRQQELKGILTFSEAQREYAKSNDLILNVLQQIESGKSSSFVQQKKKYWLILLPILGVGMALAYLYSPKKTCPIFDAGKRTKIMLLPFQNVGDRKARPELVLQTKIRNITQKNNLSTDVEILDTFDAEKENPDFDDADKLGMLCAANLIVWGQYSVGTDSNRISIQYKSLLDGRTGTTDFVGYKDVTALQSGQMNKDLEDVVRSLCTMIALRENRIDKAKEWLLKNKEKGSLDDVDEAMMTLAQK
jgi:hypothetical protein